jgi:hypothetical protein
MSHLLSSTRADWGGRALPHQQALALVVASTAMSMGEQTLKHVSFDCQVAVALNFRLPAVE